MSEEHQEAGKLDEAEEVFDVIFPSGDESAVVLHPGKEPFHCTPPANTMVDGAGVPSDSKS